VEYGKTGYHKQIVKKGKISPDNEENECLGFDKESSTHG
jgi:hypothetical protein